MRNLPREQFGGMNRLVIRPYLKMAIAVSDNSMFRVGEAISIYSSASTWPKWANKLRLWRWLWVRRVLDWKYPPKFETKEFTITGVTGSDTIAI